jgi:two-component system KDP operon response regulator KdpE
MATAIFKAFREAPAASTIFREALFVHAENLVVQTSEETDGKRPFCVLVVDDDPSIRRMIVAALRRDGYVFREAPNGKEALDVMRSEHPNVVVLDLMMPVLSGWDVLQARELEPDLKEIPVIIISANRAPEVATAVDKGICAFLPKPFDIGALSALVRSCLVPGTQAGGRSASSDEAEAPR